MSASASIDPTPAPEEVEVKAEELDLEKTRKNFQLKAQAYLAEQTRHVVIPSFSKWFDLNEIHEIEKKAFPDFFGKETSAYKTSDAYKHMRDFMINCYRLNPIEYLTVTAVRRSVTGDVSTIIRVHQFLEKWGLINYQIDPRTKSSVVGPQYTGHFQVTLDTPRGLVPFIPENLEVKDSAFPSPPASEADRKEDSQNLREIPLNLELRHNVYTDVSDNAANGSAQYICSVSGKDTNDVRYHNLKAKNLANSIGSAANSATTISESSFQQGLFPSNFQSTDFVRMTKDTEGDNWSEQEVLLLLEGIEMYGTYDLINNANINQVNSNSNGQWTKISEHVGSKTKEQCIIKFIQLPIEDRYLSKLVNTNDEPSAGVDRETLVAEIAQKLVERNEGKKVIQDNAQTKIDQITKETESLVEQIIELSLEKFELKLNNLKSLENNLISVENKLNLERKQVLLERWLQYENVYKFKEQHQDKPELVALADELLVPIKLSVVNSKFTEKIELTKEEIDNKAKEQELNNLPISVTKPKAYQFWSG